MKPDELVLVFVTTMLGSAAGYFLVFVLLFIIGFIYGVVTA